ncbi:unnamed protein product [Hydatigera taeniaeformis]|uniref:Centrosomal protein of 97 kDa n=1 Tax=Hydatigena taeniaeformis TaxID=6205 RepID=A0A158RDH2_HYDTA|nr:unnamed protein product [Hydatigera taeniaeformis]
MCSTIINLSEHELETLDYSYENATAIILDKNNIRDINTISFMTNVQQTLLLHCNRIATLKTAEAFLPQSLCILSLAENDIPNLTELMTVDCLLNAHLRLLGEWIAGSGAVHRCSTGGEAALIEFLHSLDSESPHQVGPRFRQRSDVTPYVACSSASVLKCGLTATNDNTTPPISRRDTPPRWLQRARSAQNVNATAAVAASICLADSANGVRNVRPFQCQPQIPAASCNAIPTLMNPCVPHLLRSESVFIPIDSRVEFEEMGAEATVGSPKNVAQTVSVDLPADWHSQSAYGPIRSENIPVLTDTQKTHYSPHFLRSLTALSQKLESVSSSIGETKEVDPKARKSSSVPDVENNRHSDASPVHRLQFSCGVLSSFLQNRPHTDDGPAINVISEKAEHHSNDEATDNCSPLSEHTFVVDPPSEAPKLPEGLEAKVLALRRQLEDLRVLSAKQERERLRQANDIRRLAEEVRSLKVWKASVLQHRDVNHPAAGDCKHHAFQSVTDPNLASQRVWSVHTSTVSPSLSTLVAINTSSPTNATENFGVATVYDVEGEEGEGDEEVEESPVDDLDNDVVEVDDFPGPRASSSDINGTLLTANISTDSLDTRRSRLSTPMSFDTSPIRLRNVEDRQLASESVLLPTDAI